MALVSYQCNVCKRTKQFVQNPTGLESIGRCSITLGCRGYLYQQKLLPDHIRPEIPDPVQGLDDWFRRKVLHNHTQAIERDEWTIEHNLGTFPSISVFVDRPIEGNLDNREEITPIDIVINDENTLTLKFDRQWSGIAQLVARQTDPDLFDEFSEVEPTTAVTNLQLSNNGAVTIATLISAFNAATNMSFDIKYNRLDIPSLTQSVIHPVDDQPSINSSWNDFDRVVIKGKIYLVRSFNLIEQIAGTIPTGSSFFFDRINPDTDAAGGGGAFQDIEKGQVLILLADEPFGNVDKNTREFIDVTSVTQTQNPFSLFINSPEVFATTNIVQQVFPPIRSV